MKSIFSVAFAALLACVLFVLPVFGQDGQAAGVQDVQAAQSGDGAEMPDMEAAESVRDAQSSQAVQDAEAAAEGGSAEVVEDTQTAPDGQNAEEAGHAGDGAESAEPGDGLAADADIQEIEEVGAQNVLDVRSMEEADQEELLAAEEESGVQEEQEVVLESEETEEAEEVLAVIGEERRGSTRLGVLWLESSTGHDQMAHELTRVMIEKLDSLRLYEMYYPEDVEKALKEARVRTPGDCRDPKCVSDIGRALGLRRMIYGSVDMIGSSYAVRLELFNVITGRPIEVVSIQGAPGVPARDVLLCAIDRVHGHPGRLHVTQYFGPPVNNLKEFLWSTIAVQGTGIFYSMINYGVGGSGGGSDVTLAPGAYDKEPLSGISGASNQIPIFARPAALANAYTAVSDDAYGVLYNPAGMAWLGQRDAAVAYQSRFGVMDVLAVSYANRALRDLGFGQALLLSTDRDGAMTELFFVTAAGYRINQDYLFGPMSVGAAIKFMGNTVRALSLDSPRGQSYGFGMDLGFMWELSRDIRYGLMFRDIPSINRWKNITTNRQYSEFQPPTMHMGGVYRASHSALLVADGQIPLYGDQPWVMAGGIEYEFFRMLALRIGLQREILDEESNWWKITGGAGFKFDTKAAWGKYTILDIAYEYNTLALFPVVNMSLKVGF